MKILKDKMNDCPGVAKDVKSSDPCVIAIFGITGDLARKKILPALYNLFKMGLLNPRTRIIGIGRRKYSNIEYNEYIKSSA
ncbi:MAG: Glucose-6-phosphate 1-dehydrogenase, partial [uncultured bacterium]